MTDERPVRVDKVAAQLGVNRDTVRRWLREGKLRGKWIGGRTGYLVLPAEVRRFVSGESAGQAVTGALRCTP